MTDSSNAEGGQAPQSDGGNETFALSDSRVTMVLEADLTGRPCSIGAILKLMDRAACLSAEMLAQAACVTLSMDDLKVFQQCPPTHRVVVTAEVTRAFNTSMEVRALVHGVHHGITDLLVCESFFTFVALGPPGGDGTRAKVKLRPATPGSLQAKANFKLAAERRKLRFKAKETVDAAVHRHMNMVEHGASPDEADAGKGDRGVGNTSDLLSVLDFETLEIVFPQHTQHHGTTFGGVIMSWAVSCAMNCGERYARGSVQVQQLDEVVFREPSTVGDRLRLRARVNHATENSMEVGVRIEAWAVGGPTRHINSIFLDLSTQSKLRPLHTLGIDSDPSRVRRFAAAEGRKEIRSLRSSIRIRTFPSSVELTAKNMPELCLTNVGQALSLRAAHFDSRPLSVSDIDVAWRVENESEKGGSVSRLNSGGLSSTAEDDPQAAQMVFLKLSLQLPGVKSGASVAQFIGDTSKRTLWDHDVKTYQVHRQLVNTDHDTVVRMTRKSGGGRPPVEFVLLRSIRSDDVDGTHLLAFRSVTLVDEPCPSDGFVRGSISSVSFFIEPTSDGCTVRYIIHIPPALQPFDIITRLKSGETLAGSWVERQFASLSQLRRVLLSDDFAS